MLLQGQREWKEMENRGKEEWGNGREGEMTGNAFAQNWRDFIAGELYPEAQVPWRDDPAYGLLLQVPGLRESIGGRSAAALHQAIGLVRALTGIDLHAGERANRPAQGLCLGFGMNLMEPYDLLQVFKLNRVHAYEWIGEHVTEAAQALQALRTTDQLLPDRLRLHHGIISDLCALADGSIRVVYTANVFTPEIPMTEETFAGAVQEILRVLEAGGILLSRGSHGVLEATLTPHGRMLLQTPLVSVFAKA